MRRTSVLFINFSIGSLLDPSCNDRKVDTANSTDHTAPEHSQTGCRLPAVEHYNPQPYAQTLHGTYPSGMTAYTSYALSLPGESPSYLSYYINPAWMHSDV
nr:hypothetical protein [Tanacetum cinerariifolium]